MAVFFLLRVGRKGEIDKQFKEKYIEFSCPENWINLARNNKESKVGDELECVVAHLPKDDESIYDVFPGYPFDREYNGTIKTEIDDKSIYYSWALFTQTPTICFYSRDIAEEMKNSLDGTVEFDLDEYCKEIGYNPLDSSYLLIYNPQLFFDDLEQQLPTAIEMHKEIGNIYPYEPAKNLSKFLQGGYIKIIKDDEFFIESDSDVPCILRKIQRHDMPDFEKLHEYRLYTMKYFFWQFDRNDGLYNYKKNLLKVNLPNIKDYASSFDGSVYSRVKIFNFVPEKKTFTIMGVFRKKEKHL